MKQKNVSDGPSENWKITSRDDEEDIERKNITKITAG